MIGYFEEPVQKNLYESYTGDIFDSEFYLHFFQTFFEITGIFNTYLFCGLR